MAFPVVEAVAESSVNTAGTSHTVTLPASIDASDMVLILMDIGSTSATLNALTDWTEILDEALANGLKILIYTGAGVPGNPTFTSSAATRSASIAYRISGADKAITPQRAVTTASGTSTTPDPPQAPTPSGGTKDHLFIVFAGMAGEEADDDTWATASPTNYSPSPPRQKACGTAGAALGGLIMSAERALTTGGVENPAPFTVAVSAAWRAQTLIVHPLSNVVIPLDASNAVGSATLDLSAPTAIPLAAGAAVGSATLALRAPTTIPLDVGSAVASGTLDLSTPAPVVLPLAGSTASGTASLGLRAPALIGIDGDAAGSGSLSLATIPRLSLVGSAQGSGSLAVFIDFGDLYPEEDLYPSENLYPGEQPPDEGPAILGLQAGAAQGSGSLAITTPASLALSGSSVASGSMPLRVPEMLVLTGSAQASGTLLLGYRPRLALAGSAVASGTLGLQALSTYAVHRRLNVYVAETNLSLQTIIPESQLNLLMTVTEPVPLNVEPDENVHHIADVDERTTPIQIVEVVGIQVFVDETPDIMNVEVDD